MVYLVTLKVRASSLVYQGLRQTECVSERNLFLDWLIYFGCHVLPCLCRVVHGVTLFDKDRSTPGTPEAHIFDTIHPNQIFGFPYLSQERAHNSSAWYQEKPPNRSQSSKPDFCPPCISGDPILIWEERREFLETERSLLLSGSMDQVEPIF